MADVLTPEQRRKCMSAIRSADTGPEKLVRTMVHKMGYRFRLGGCGLPGRPDLVFPRHRKVVFVHGCFWHRHRCPAGRPEPKTRAEFWAEKFSANMKRDAMVRRRLRMKGWKSLVIWQCHLKDEKKVRLRLDKFLRPDD